MYITITMKVNDRIINIRVDKRQTISDVYAVIKDREGLTNIPLPKFYKSFQNKKLISSLNTFEQEQIYSGDILDAVL